MADLKENNQHNSMEFEKSNDADNTATAPGIVTNVAKRSERFKSVTVWIVCFVNLIYYADRLTFKLLSCIKLKN